VHAILIAAAARMAGTNVAAPPRPPTDFFWIGAPRPSPEPDPPAEPPTVNVVTPPAEIPPESPAAAPAPERATTEPAPSEPAAQGAEQPLPVPDPPERPRVLTRSDLDEARRRAVTDVLARRARASEFAPLSAEDLMEARPPPEAPRPTRSIFDTRSSGSRRSAFAPGQARTRLGHRLASFCNALTGGYGVLGFGSFSARPNNEPSGLFPELMPEYLKLMPDCVETRPLGPLLAEASEFPTVKCRLVPKDRAYQPDGIDTRTP
jgi:hypothetical protein